MKRKQSASGFSALEALVAVAIIAVALVPLLDLQTQVTRDAVRQQALYAESVAIQDGLALLRDLNPMANESGALPHGEGGQIVWRARPITRPTQTTLGGSGYGPFDVQLYTVEIEVTAQSGAAVAAFSVDKLGWRGRSSPRSQPTRE
jgi:Tfp pilus assembly protein PilV